MAPLSLCYTAEGHYLYKDLDGSCGCSTCTLHHFFSFHICDRAAEDKQVEKTDQNPTVHS